MDNPTNGRNNGHQRRGARAPLQTPVDDQDRNRGVNSDPVQDQYPLRERDRATYTAPTRPFHPQVRPGIRENENRDPRTYVPPPPPRDTTEHRRIIRPWPPRSRILDALPMPPNRPVYPWEVNGLDDPDPVLPQAPREPQLQPYPGSRIFEALLRDSQPEPFTERNLPGTQPPVGTPRDVEARTAETVTGHQAGRNNRSVSNEDAGVTQVAPGQDIAQRAATQAVQQSTSQSVDTDQTGDSTAAQPTAPQNEAVRLVLRGGASEPGDNTTWLYMVTVPLPIRDSSDRWDFIPVEPRLVKDSDRAGRRYAAMTIRSKAPNEGTALLNGETYLLNAAEARRYPHEMDQKSPIWGQSTHGEQFANIESSPATLVEAFHEASEVLLYYNPEFFQMINGARVINIKVDDIDTLYHAIQCGSWTLALKVNRRIQWAYERQAGKGYRHPLYLLFSVSGSKQYCALAEMVGPLRPRWRVRRWPRPDCQGVLPIRFIYVKNVPFAEFTDLPMGDKGQSVVNMWSGMPFDEDQGRVVVERYVKYAHRSNVLLFLPREGPAPLFTADGECTWGRASALGMYERLLHCLKEYEAERMEGPHADGGRRTAPRTTSKLRDRNAFAAILAIVQVPRDDSVAAESPAAVEQSEDDSAASSPMVGLAFNTMHDPFVGPSQAGPAAQPHEGPGVVFGRGKAPMRDFKPRDRLDICPPPPQHDWLAAQARHSALQLHGLSSSSRGAVPPQAEHHDLIARSGLSIVEKNAYANMQLNKHRLEGTIHNMQLEKLTLEANMKALERKARLSLDPFNRGSVTGTHDNAGRPDDSFDTDGGVRL